MQREQPMVVTGAAFVQCVIDNYRDRAGDVLLEASGGRERDWLELKASFYVRQDDPDFANPKMLVGKPQGDSDADWLNKVNLGRIAQTILAMYNTRGGVILIGVAPDCGHTPVPLSENDPHGILSSGSHDLGDYIDDAVARLMQVGRYTRGSDFEIPSGFDKLFSREIVSYKGQKICALVVKTCPFACQVAVRRLLDGGLHVFSRDRKASGRNASWDVSTTRKLNEFSLARKDVLLDSELRQLASNTSGPAYCAPEILSRYLERWIGAVPGDKGNVSVGSPEGFRAPHATFGESWQRLWSLSVTGRAPRSEFWADMGLYLILMVLCSFLGRVFWNFPLRSVFALLPHLATVLLLPPMVRRLHDMGRSGGYAFALPFLYYIDTLFPAALNLQTICFGLFGLAILVLGCAPGKAQPTAYDMMRKGKRMNWGLLALMTVVLAAFGFLSLSVPDIVVPSIDISLGTPPATHTKMDEMVFNQIKAFGCVYQDRYEREISPLLQKGSDDAAYKHMLFLKDERDDFMKVRELYRTGSGLPTASVKTFGIPAEGLVKGVDAIILIHDRIIDLQVELLKSGSRNPQREEAAKLKRYFAYLDKALDNLFAYAEGLGLDLD